MACSALWSWLQEPPGSLLPPLLLVVLIAASDLRSRRIPNVLTFGGALAGLLWQMALGGLAGLGQGALGLLTGLGLLLPVYLLGGMGAGDVKALAALGAWLGPRQCLVVFCYMGLAGGLLSLGVLLWRRLLGVYLRRGWQWLLSLILLGRERRWTAELALPAQTLEGVPYGVAIALGMGALVVWGSFLG